MPEGAFAPAAGVGGSVRLRLAIAYDGTDFSGWARQPGRRTVCGVLEGALHTVLRSPVALTVAGRTDAGVHASGQVAHLDVAVGGSGVLRDPDLTPARLVHRLARLLPADVRVTAAEAVSADFDARFAALRRHYSYRLTTARSGAEPLRARDTVAWPRPLDADRMRAASIGLLGEHDFAAFCRRREGATTVRELQRLDWESGGGGLLVARVSADAFCHSMVRSLVGAVLAVGEGRREVGWPAALLTERARVSSVGVAPAHGLCLTGVDYPPASEWSLRSARTRAVRSPAAPTTTAAGPTG